jgi:hypothetical protein
MLTVEDVATHWNLTPDTIRRYIASGRLPAQKLNRQHRTTWEDVWGCEEGPFPRNAGMRTRYQMRLADKAALQTGARVSRRTVDGWIADGMPTRRVFGNVLANPIDVAEWLKGRFDVEIAPETFLSDEPSHSATQKSAQ